jgi:hypothetical protein
MPECTLCYWPISSCQVVYNLKSQEITDPSAFLTLFITRIWHVGLIQRIYTVLNPRKLLSSLFKKLHSLERYDTAQNYTELFSFCLNITSKSRIIAIFKSFVKENIQIKLIGTPMIFYCIKLHLSVTFHDLSPWNRIQILTFNRPSRSYFWFLRKKLSAWKLFVIWISISKQYFIIPSLLL